MDQFEIDGSTLRVDKVGDVKPSLIIGGSDKSRFVPNINTSFEFESGSEKFWWNLNALDVIVANQKPTIDLDQKKVSLRVGNIEEQYRIEGSGEDELLKWYRIFYTHPGTNIFNHRLSFAPGVDFCYQPALTPGEVSTGKIFRPAEVVGSYAVYCNSGGHLVDSKGQTLVHYRAGKMGMIYPPWFTDADGKKKRAVLFIDPRTGLYRITIDRIWFENAQFPVVANDTFGWTSPGGSNHNFAAGKTAYGGIDTLAPAGTLTNLTCYSWPVETTDTKRYGFYDDDSNPKNLVVEDAVAWTSGNSADWYTNPVAWSYELVENAQYWGAIGEVGGDVGSLFYDTAGSQAILHYDDGVLPDPAAISSIIDPSAHISMYGTYIAGGGVTHQLAGSLNSASQLTGLLNLIQRLSGSLNSTSHASGVLRLIQRLSGSLNSSSVVSGTLRLIHGLSGAVQSASQVAGNIRLTQRLSGLINSISTLTGKLILKIRISGSLNSTTHLSGDLHVPTTHSLSGSLNSTSHLSGTLTEDRIQEIILASGTRTLQLEASGIRTTQLTASGYRTLQLTASGTKE